MVLASTELKSVGDPLAPLAPRELERVVSIVKSAEWYHSGMRFVSVSLKEPRKEDVLSWSPGKMIDREAKVILLDNLSGDTHEVVVSLTGGVVVSSNVRKHVQPPIMLDEFYECERAVKQDHRFLEALRRRGITDPSLVMVDPWSAGNFGSEEENTRRLSRALCWYRTTPDDNGYAHPIEGLVVVVDLNKMEVIRVEDYGVIPLADEPGNYSGKYIKDFRDDLKPIQILQPDGPSYVLDGNRLKWQKWSLRIGFTPREGLVIYTVCYEDAGKERPILYRGSLSEMVVPYGDPAPTQYTKSAFDAGEYGIGMLANSLQYGCDCIGAVSYLDAHMTNSRGEVICIPNAICIHEEDTGMLWKHTDWRTGEVEIRRGRRLVVSSISTVANYEYGFYWYFYQDGTIQYEVKLTGIVSTAGIADGETPRYGTVLAKRMYAPYHQHFFNVRLDMMIDGLENTVVEVDTVPEESDRNPYGNAFVTKSTVLRNESEAKRRLRIESARYWKIINQRSFNKTGQPVGYKLVPGENCLPFASETSSFAKRAEFTAYHLWVTKYNENEMHAAGDYPNQNPGGGGLAEWTHRNERIEDTDVVVWYTMGHHHVPRLEDWPVMPTATIGFALKPVGFFDANPALDVPPSESECSI
ncbi:primary-amine oxidase [Alicyclobacillus mali (ex Roth et al. 2021)]|uniref:primary-amine oxidase n=1 Tax=Alicyclobacillus mali (ex Roth et al. 2021) TaxID=1123961 RepID=UPI001A8F2B26|nr:primary-amine oxidase [Alicyclobacillus mali (ex Roth et al. 2021)]